MMKGKHIIIIIGILFILLLGIGITKAVSLLTIQECDTVTKYYDGECVREICRPCSTDNETVCKEETICSNVTVACVKQTTENICKDDGSVEVDAQTVAYDDAFCAEHDGKIHCDKVKCGEGGCDSNGDGFCQDGEDDCMILNDKLEVEQESWHPIS